MRRSAIKHDPSFPGERLETQYLLAEAHDRTQDAAGLVEMCKERWIANEGRGLGYLYGTAKL